MLPLIRRLANAPFWLVGLDVRRLRHPSRKPPTAGDLWWLKQFDIRTVIDVGACWGQFARTARRVLPDAMIHSFEPLPDLHHHLVESMISDGRFHAYPVALGEAEGEVEMYRNAFPDSSSLLRMSDSHKEMFPFTRDESLVRVPLRRLDAVLSARELDGPLLLKLDVQGYELAVLRGGADMLARADIVLIEASFISLYEHQPLFEEVYDHLRQNGLAFAGSAWQLDDPATGLPVQADAIFVRRAAERT